MPPAWERLAVIVDASRPVLYPDGSVAPASEQAVAGSRIDHWVAVEYANAWFRQAREYLDDKALLAQCDAEPNFTDPAKNAEQSAKQLDFVGRVAWSICQGYNALNLVAMNDPRVRYAYHRWVSGPPAGDSVSTMLDNWFQPERNFGGGSFSTRTFGRWYFPNETWPIFGSLNGRGPAQAPVGFIAKLARSAFERFYPDAATHPSEFVVNVELRLERDPESGEPTPAPVDYQRVVRNRPLVEPRTVPGGGFSAGESRGIGYMPDGRRLPWGVSGALGARAQGFWDWRAVFFDVDPIVGAVGNGDKMGLVAPMRAYLDFLNEIVDAALERSPAQIIQDTRVFVTWMNARQIQRAYVGDAGSFLSAVGVSDASTRMQELAGSPAVTLAARSIGTFGAGIGAVVGKANPLAGGIVALASGAVSGVLTLINTAIRGDVTGKGKNDLGRYKPWLARGVLGGDITNETSGQPTISGLEPPPSGLGGFDPAAYARLRRRLDQQMTDRFLGLTSGGQRFDGFDWGEFKYDEGGEGGEGPGLLGWALLGAVVVGGAVAVRRSRTRRGKR